MSTLCPRCALRLRSTASPRRPFPSPRTFSSSVTRGRAALPQFHETSQPELDNVLASLRDKWLIPASLSKQERNLIYKQRYKKQLDESPEVITVGDEEIELQHINRLTDVPSFKKELMPKIVDLMSRGEPSDWNNLPALLIGLHRAKLTPKHDVMAKLVRRAIEAGRFGIILTCLQQVEHTGMTLREPAVLNNVLYTLRHVAQQEEWSEAATSKAIREAQEIALLLEAESHGNGTLVTRDDPRTRPDVLAVYLELAAVYAYKHQDGKDVDGKVKVYWDRLLGNMSAIKETSSKKKGQKVKASIGPSYIDLPSSRAYEEIRRGIPIYQGLRVASRVLGEEASTRALADRAVRKWEQGLSELVDRIQTQAEWREPGSYTVEWQALNAWRSCLKLDL